MVETAIFKDNPS